MGKTIIPEFIQDDCNAQDLTKALIKVITDKKCRDEYKKNYVEFFKKMNFGDKKSSSEKAVDAILSILK